MDLVFVIIICVCMIALWLSMLLASRKNGKKLSKGQWISTCGTTVICIGLLLHNCEGVPRGVYMTVQILGVVIEIIALIFILKRSEL